MTLSASLSEERVARREQYEYYRDRLLSFEEVVSVSEPRPSRYEPIAVSSESTVVAEFIPDAANETTYQSEADLEREFIKLLQSQAYEYLPITTEAQLVANLRAQFGDSNCDHVLRSKSGNASSLRKSLGRTTASSRRPSASRRTTSRS